MKKRPTSQQVAKRAGVSRTTVSFVLNDVPMNISKATKEKVFQAAQELGYVPDAAARMLVSGQSRAIGLVICNAQHLLVDAFIPQVLYGINEAIRNYGFRVIVETVDSLAEPSVQRGLVASRQIDGIAILNPRREDSNLIHELSEQLPLVDVGKMGLAEGQVSREDSPDIQGARQALEHLIHLGHTNIAHISFAPKNFSASNRRLETYWSQLERYGLRPRAEYVRYGNYSAQSGFEQAQALFALNDRPTAIFAGNDTIAFGILSAAYRAGLGVPEDLAVVGFDDIPLASSAAPPLTTIKIDAVGMGYASGITLLQQLLECEFEQTQVAEPVLVVRASCGSSKQH